VGFAPDQVMEDGKEHIGMENVRDRLKSMSDASMKVESIVGVGTTVTVNVPKKTEKHGFR
jgi:sensor histidine kinase YesM